METANLAISLTFFTRRDRVRHCKAQAAAGSGVVEIVGGAATVRQHLAAGLLDELVLHLVPVVPRAGECLLEGLDAPRNARKVTR
jgi:dihydrofolate reductase